MPRNRSYEDDDGRVIADMSDVERTPILLPRLGGKRGQARRPDVPEETRTPVTVTKEERRALIKGGIAAGLAVGLALAAGFGALILLINLIGR